GAVPPDFRWPRWIRGPIARRGVALRRHARHGNRRPDHHGARDPPVGARSRRRLGAGGRTLALHVCARGRARADARRCAPITLVPRDLLFPHDLLRRGIPALGAGGERARGHWHDAGGDLARALARALGRAGEAGYWIGSALTNVRVWRSKVMRTRDALPASTSAAAPIAGLTLPPQLLPITSATGQNACMFFCSARCRSARHPRLTIETAV